MNTALYVLATCGPASPISIWWLHRITTMRTIARTPQPDSIAVIPANRYQDAVLYVRTGYTTRYFTVPGTRRTTNREEPRP